MLWLSIAILALVTAERLAELAWSAANTARLIAAGGIEYGQGHYPAMVALHAAWLGGLWLLAWDRPIVPFFLAIFLLAQAGRAWVLLTMKRRWTTRIVVVPGENLVMSGPYRYMRHPNYLAVAIEIATLPLAFGLVGYAIVFSLFNGLVLTVRIRAENAALTLTSDRAETRQPLG